jgi:predicted RNase H-like HicB family nuclease
MMDNYFDAVRVKTREEADAALDELIMRALKEDRTLTPQRARQIQLANIGYCFGDLSREEAERAMELYREASHPILGRRLPGDIPQDVLLRAGMAVAQAYGGDSTATFEKACTFEEAIRAGREVIEAYEKENRPHVNCDPGQE